MGDDALDALLKSPSIGRRSRLPGLKVADILTMPPEQQSVVNWLMRHYEALPETIAERLGQPLEQVQGNLKDLLNQEFLKTIERNGQTYYRVKLAPKSGRQMPTDVWQVLESNTQQANVFISYSRRNKEFVQELHSALEATDREVWVDWENIPVAVDWWKEIQLGIEVADTFLFVLSPDSVASKVCGQEIEEAIQHNKRLVPVVCQDVQPDLVHPELSRLNWIFLRPQDDFQQGFKRLLEALDQDLDYVRTHTRILVRALEWDRNNRDSSYLLRGADLERANQYLSQGKEQAPRPTGLHHQYVLASAEAETATRAAELRRQRQLVVGQRRWLQLVTAMSVLAMALGLSSLGLSRQAQTAQATAEKAQLKALTQSSEAWFLSNQRFEALLAAVQAGRLFQKLDPEQQTPELRAQVMSSLQQALFWVQERNRLEGHTGTVWQVAFSPNGQTLASVSADGTVRLWDLEGQSLGLLDHGGAPLKDLGFAPNGDSLVSVDTDGNLYLWSQAGDQLAKWQAHVQPIRAVEFSPEGQYIATAGEDATVKIWDQTGRLIRALDTDGRGLQALVWTRDNRIVAGDEQGTIYVWSASGERQQTFAAAHTGAITALDFSPTQPVLVSAGRDRRVSVYNLETGTRLNTITEAHQASVYNVKFTPNGEQVITVGEDKLVHIWQLDGTRSETLVGHTGLVSALAIDATGEMIATSGGDHAVRLWELERNNLVVLQGHQGAVNTVAIAPTGDEIVSGGADGQIKLWRRDGSPVKSLEGHTGAVLSVAYSPDGTQLASVSADGTARLWNGLDTVQPSAQVLSGHVGGVNAVAYHPSGDLLATAGEDRTLRLWRVDGTLVKTVDAHRDGVLSVAFSPDGKYLASSSWDHRIRIWTVDSIDTTPPLTLENHRGWVLDTQFSPDGTQLASASYDNTVKLWDVRTGKLVTTLEGHQDGVLAVGFSPDGQRLVTASNDNAIRIWDLQGTLLATLSGHAQGVRDIAVGPQGDFLVSASSDSRILIWERKGMDSIDSLLHNSCNWLSEYLSHNRSIDPETRELCQMHNEMDASSDETVEESP